jgi:hypothetical protein
MSTKSNDFDIRFAVVKNLINSGVPRSDIRHEITLDTSSSGGRADIVLLRDGSITGYELKSAKDNLDRCKDQKHSYEMAFDTSVLVVDSKWGPIGSDGFFDREKKNALWQNHAIYKGGKIVDRYCAHEVPIISSHFSASTTLSARRMISLLWASEVMSMVGASARFKGINAAAENMSIKDIRRGVVDALRRRRLNLWEEAFWERFDGKITHTEPAE